MQTDGNAMFELRPLTDDQVVSKLQRLSTYGTDDWRIAGEQSGWMYSQKFINSASWTGQRWNG